MWGYREGRCSLSALCRDVRGHGVAAVHDHGQGLAVVGLLEGGVAAHQHVQDDPQAPDVCKKQQQQQLRLHSPWPRRDSPPQGPWEGLPHQPLVLIQQTPVLTGMFLGGNSSQLLPHGQGDHTPTKAGKGLPILTSNQVSRDFTKAVEVLTPCPGRDRKASPELCPSTPPLCHTRTHSSAHVTPQPPGSQTPPQPSWHQAVPEGTLQQWQRNKARIWALQLHGDQLEQEQDLCPVLGTGTEPGASSLAPPAQNTNSCRCAGLGC